MKELANIRNDVVGSLLRPPELKQARQRYDEGKLSLGELRRIEDREIRSAVRLQEGEHGRQHGHPVADAAGGPGQVHDQGTARYPGHATGKHR